MQNSDNFKQLLFCKKNAAVKVNHFYLQTTQRKGKKGGGCTGEKPVHAETYIFTHIMRLGRWGVHFFFWGGGGGGGLFILSLTGKYPLSLAI